MLALYKVCYGIYNTSYSRNTEIDMYSILAGDGEAGEAGSGWGRRLSTINVRTEHSFKCQNVIHKLCRRFKNRTDFAVFSILSASPGQPRKKDDVGG